MVRVDHQATRAPATTSADTARLMVPIASTVRASVPTRAAGAATATTAPRLAAAKRHPNSTLRWWGSVVSSLTIAA
jgi:hypothetical protein